MSITTIIVEQINQFCCWWHYAMPRLYLQRKKQLCSTYLLENIVVKPPDTVQPSFYHLLDCSSRSRKLQRTCIQLLCVYTSGWVWLINAGPDPVPLPSRIPSLDRVCLGKSAMAKISSIPNRRNI